MLRYRSYIGDIFKGGCDYGFVAVLEGGIEISGHISFRF